METKRIELRDLEPNTGQLPGIPENPRDWDKADVKVLARSMAETPELMEARGLIVVPREDRYVIIGGNMRYEAAKELRWKDIPCIVVPADTPADRVKAMILKDNSTFGKWNFDKLKADFGEFEFQDIGIAFPELPKGNKKAKDDGYDPDAAYAKIKQPITKRGDVIRLGEHVLICGDSTDAHALERLMTEGGVPLICS